MSPRPLQLLSTTPALEDSLAWTSALRGAPTQAREDALARLHALLLRAAQFEMSRRRDQLSHLGAAALEDLAVQAADDALMSILCQLDDFHDESRFTTWAYKFAVLEAGVKARRRAWQDRELPLDRQAWDSICSDGPRSQSALEDREALAVLFEAMQWSLTPHQREILIALALNLVPIDVLAERRSTTRGALYETLHDARRKLRAALAARADGQVEDAR